MAKQTVNVGASPNDNSGDSIRIAFQKINANFTELYTELGLDEAPLNLGAFEFTGSTITTTDSSAVTIDQATTVSSDLTVGGDIVPNVAAGGNLGSVTKPWHSLYVSNNTIYIGEYAIGVDDAGNLTVGGTAVNAVGSADWSAVTNKPSFAAVATSGSYVDLTNKPTIPSLGNIVFDANVISNPVGEAININAPFVQLVSTDGTYIWAEDGYGAGIEVTYVGGSRIWKFDSAGSITFPDSTVQTTAWTGSISSLDGDVTGSVFADDSTMLVDAVAGKIVGDIEKNGILTLRTTDNDMRFYAADDFYFEAGEGANDFVVNAGLIELGGDVELDGTLTFPDATVQTTAYTGPQTSLDGDVTGSVFADDSTILVDGVAGKLRGDIENNNVDIVATASDVSITAADDIDLTTLGSSGDIRLSAGDDVSITTGVFNGNNYEWFFASGGYLSFPDGADLQFNNTSDGITFDTQYNPEARPSIRITADTGNSQADLLLENETDVGNILLRTNGANNKIWTFGADGDIIIPGNIKSEGNINIDINLSDSTLRRWQFGEDGDLTFPDGTNQSTAYNGILPSLEQSGGGLSTPTALDLTKQLQILNSDNGIWFTLADGVEGQIMYFTPLVSGLHITVAHARIRNTSNGSFQGVTDFLWRPDLDSSTQATTFAPRTIAMAIFVDGAWSLTGGQDGFIEP